MKNLRKTLALLLAIVLLAGALPLTVLAASFTDVPNDVYYAEPVRWSVEKGIVYGTSSSTFSPNAKCTIEQIITFLWRAAGSPEPSSDELPYPDVKADDYFCKAAQWAKEKQIIRWDKLYTGYTCTRAFAVRFIWRAFGSPQPKAACPFEDMADHGDRDAATWAMEQGITSGTSPTVFSPDESCTRGQIASFLYRAYAGESSSTPSTPPAPPTAKTPDDPFSFNNSSKNFGSTYAISNDALSFLLSNEPAYSAQWIRNKMDKTWGGSCFGMSAVYVLYRNGAVTPVRYQSGASKLLDLNPPRSNGSVNDLVNFYHLSQMTAEVNSLRAKSSDYKDSALEEQNLRTLIQRLDENKGPLLMGVKLLKSDTELGGGHAIVAIGYTKDSAGNYVVQIWDPNRPAQFNSLTISPDYKSHSFAEKMCGYDKVFISYALPTDMFNLKDFERHVSSAANPVYCSSVTVGSSDFRVACSDGTFAEYRGGTQTGGTLNLVDITPECMAEDVEFSGEKVYAFTAPADSSITVTSSGMDEITVCHSGLYAKAEAGSLSSMTVSMAKVSVNCASSVDQTVTIASDILGDTWNALSVTGTDTSFSLDISAGMVNISGANKTGMTVSGSNAFTGSTCQSVEIAPGTNASIGIGSAGLTSYPVN